ncbi:tryptophan 2,3-dioxygenase family protein [Kutzneria kofuensis]|uniref:Tryptophan 2,3-dioxygenase n=1 Tax=Kutzneria kofuensis TaxID=103725 RepID=A0A7W9NKN6_9PSEU|nr:tryptophan 2,3-dioxygenase family protein [Kutzneria kofuensis]MBB5895566.1 tryptophan 2,3-dioxygenase [Kutzneria kofuensis]
MPAYGAYLQLPALLDRQRPHADAHDELLFITVHQVFELWFKQLLFELGDARDRMLAGESYLPRKRLERAVVIQRALLGQFDVLDTMEPQDFNEFRTALGTGNGGQSAQFWEIALLSGSRDASYLDRPWYTKQERARLRRRYEEPSLWEGFLALLADAGFDVATRSCRADACRQLAARTDRYRQLWDLAEALIAHDQAWASWQSRHLLTVQRQIGRKRGTGGSAGAAHLKSHLDNRFYPELWELRATL